MIALVLAAALGASVAVPPGLVEWLDRSAPIVEAWPRKELTPQGSRLGGGIGFHSWASKWDADAGTLMSFGCVVLHPEDVADFYARIRVGDLVVLR